MNFKFFLNFLGAIYPIIIYYLVMITIPRSIIETWPFVFIILAILAFIVIAFSFAVSFYVLLTSFDPLFREKLVNIRILNGWDFCKKYKLEPFQYNILVFSLHLRIEKILNFIGTSNLRLFFYYLFSFCFSIGMIFYLLFIKIKLFKKENLLNC